MSGLGWLLLLAGCAQAADPPAAVAPQYLDSVPLLVAGVPVQAEVADDDAERQQGLMGRPALPDGQGMLFVYDAEAPRGFWMKNTPEPLSIAFISGTGRIVRIAEMQPLDTHTTRSGAPAMYALEMNTGWFARNGIAAGQKVEGLPEGPGLPPPAPPLAPADPPSATPDASASPASPSP